MMPNYFNSMESLVSQLDILKAFNHGFKLNQSFLGTNLLVGLNDLYLSDKRDEFLQLRMHLTKFPRFSLQQNLLAYFVHFPVFLLI